MTAVLQSPPAFAQTHPCPLCRAQYPFTTCDAAVLANPPVGMIALAGKVVRAEKSACKTWLSVDVQRSAPPVLPGRIVMDTSPCIIWVGKTDDVINALVLEKPSEDGVYEVGLCR